MPGVIPRTIACASFKVDEGPLTGRADAQINDQSLSLVSHDRNRLSVSHFATGHIPDKDRSAWLPSIVHSASGCRRSANSKTPVEASKRRRIFNLGYYTWVEQQATEFDDFMARRDPRFWDGMRHFVEEWDELIVEFNDRTGARDDE